MRLDVCVPGPRVEDAFAAALEREAATAAQAADERREALGGAPGPELAALLAQLAVPAESDAVLLEAIDAFDRLAAWAASRQAVAVNELRRRRQSQGRAAFVADEVAARLGTTRAAGQRVVGEAMGLEQVPQVWDALDRGVVDPRKAAMLCDELLALPAMVRFDVTSEVVPLAGGLTIPALRGRIRRRGLAADPESAARAHERERRGRYVSLEPVRDGMAWLHAYLPAPEAVAVHATLTAMADAAPPDDPRGMDERRADALVDVVTRWLDAGTCPDGTPLPRRQRRRPHLQVTVAASTLAGDDDAPAELAGYGPISADMARRIARDATWSPVEVDVRTGEARVAPGSGDGRAHSGAPPGNRPPGNRPPGYRPPAAMADDVLARDRTCTFPGCRVPAMRCDLDHIEPFDPTLPADDQTVGENLHALCRHHHNLKTHGGWQVQRDDATGRTVWTAPTGHAYVREPERAVGFATDREVDPGADGRTGTEGRARNEGRTRNDGGAGGDAATGASAPGRPDGPGAPPPF